MMPRVLTIAGSDSGGGAGIQADLKTMSALGCYGMSAITAVTSQDTCGVHGVQEMPPGFVADQITRVLEDIGADAIKIGMLSSAPIIEAVADALKYHAAIPIVLDPVMVAKSGDALLRQDAQRALKSRLLPLARLVTPNLPEAAALVGIPVVTDADMERAGRMLFATGAKAVLIKGGHAEGPMVRDHLYGAYGSAEIFEHPRIDTKNTHGTGCTLSAAIASYLARGLPLTEAVRHAGDYVHGAITHALPLGKGHGPLNHLWNLTQRS